MHPFSNCPVSESQTWNWHCLLLRSKTMKPAWSQVQMSLIFTANFPKAAVKHTISMKPTWIEYLWVSLQTDFNDLFYRQTLDEFSEIQKLSREVPSLPPVSKFLSFLSLLRNVRRQSRRSWRRSWRALRAQPKRFCCLALPPIYIASHFRMTWISTLRQRNRMCQRSPAQILIIRLCLMHFLSPNLMIKVKNPHQLKKSTDYVC